MSKTTSRGKKTVNPDLARERENCTFTPYELTNILDGGELKTLERRKIGKLLVNITINLSQILMIDDPWNTDFYPVLISRRSPSTRSLVTPHHLTKSLEVSHSLSKMTFPLICMNSEYKLQL